MVTGSNLSHLAHLSKLISVEEYLNTPYRPNVEYVDGEIQERNLGEIDHADRQTAVSTSPCNRQQEWKIRVVIASRCRLPTRFRVPAVCVLAVDLAREQIIRDLPPLHRGAVPRDRLNAMRKRVQDFLDMGAAEGSSIRRRARRTSSMAILSDPMTELQSGILRLVETPIEIAVEAAFAMLDE